MRWDTTRVASEIRPIIGWHLKPVDIIINPILDTAYDGIKSLDFAPSMRVACNFWQWAIAVARGISDVFRLRRHYGSHRRWIRVRR
ncbi:MAG: hypothetical protein ABSH28_20555 [Acidobacteriota bacterium]|jgi:hypothetical protein